MVRTGIDLGTRSVKLVRGEGASALERITHVGLEEWNAQDSGDAAARASAALGRLLGKLKLKKGRLGRLAISIRGEDAPLREVTLPVLSDAELRQALPFEARKHLPLEEMASPILGYQVLGQDPAEPGRATGSGSMRVLLAAAPRARRDQALKVIEGAGLEPEVVDLEPLALLNALLACRPFEAAPGGAVALLDLGATQAGLAITQARGGLLVRGIDSVAGTGEEIAIEARLSRIAARTQETITFYRGRVRCEVTKVYLSGGVALEPGLDRAFAEAIGLPVEVFDPFRTASIAESTDASLRSAGPRFSTACGLCRWWDPDHV
jgi:type IV pilus assembly protein PilM